MGALLLARAIIFAAAVLSGVSSSRRRNFRDLFMRPTEDWSTERIQNCLNEDGCSPPCHVIEGAKCSNREEVIAFRQNDGWCPSEVGGCNGTKPYCCWPKIKCTDIEGASCISRAEHEKRLIPVMDGMLVTGQKLKNSMYGCEGKQRCWVDPGTACHRIQDHGLKIDCLIDAADCSFYDELHSKMQCKDDEYPKRFGRFYCGRFATVAPAFSMDGQPWVLKTRRCLMKKLEKYAKEGKKAGTCKQLEKDAFDSHPSCYEESGFCVIATGLQNVAALLSVFAPSYGDIFTLDFVWQVITTGNLCLVQSTATIISRGLPELLATVAFGSVSLTGQFFTLVANCLICVLEILAKWKYGLITFRLEWLFNTVKSWLGL